MSGGIKTPYYRLVFADAKTQWTYRIDAVLGNILEKQQKEVVTTDFISLEEAKKIALKDAGLDKSAQKIVFTKEVLSRNKGRPCYILEFYTDRCAYSYKVDAVTGEIIEKETEWLSRLESETVSGTSQNSDTKQHRGRSAQGQNLRPAAYFLFGSVVHSARIKAADRKRKA